MSEMTVVVGAGIAGLMFARERARAGDRVMIVEKSRGLGGRMATKRVSDGIFDQGAQFFSARTPEFAAVVDEWVHAGVAARWPGTSHRFVGQPSMTGVAKYLATGLEIRREVKLVAARWQGGVWELECDQQPPIVATRLILTAPVPQALALLTKGGVVLPEDMDAALRKITYHPCLALLVLLDGPSLVPPGGIVPEGGPVRWIADNGQKGVGPRVPAAITLHATPEFSSTHYTEDEAHVAELLLPGAKQYFGNAREISVTLHRWKFSEAREQYPEPCVWLPERSLGFAGDGFGGPKVEGAALSGLALARVLTRASAGKV